MEQAREKGQEVEEGKGQVMKWGKWLAAFLFAFNLVEVIHPNYTWWQHNVIGPHFSNTTVRVIAILACALWLWQYWNECRKDEG